MLTKLKKIFFFSAQIHIYLTKLKNTELSSIAKQVKLEAPTHKRTLTHINKVYLYLITLTFDLLTQKQVD